MKQQCEIKAVIVLSNIRGGLFNESLKSIQNIPYKTFVLSTPQIKWSSVSMSQDQNISVYHYQKWNESQSIKL